MWDGGIVGVHAKAAFPKGGECRIKHVKDDRTSSLNKDSQRSTDSSFIKGGGLTLIRRGLWSGGGGIFPTLASTRFLFPSIYVFAMGGGGVRGLIVCILCFFLLLVYNLQGASSAENSVCQSTFINKVTFESCRNDWSFVCL